MTDHLHPLPARELIRDLARRTERPQREIQDVLEALEVLIAAQLRAGRGVRLPHLGTLAVKAVPPRTRMTFGKALELPATTRVVFRPGKELREVLAAD